MRIKNRKGLTSFDLLTILLLGAGGVMCLVAGIVNDQVPIGMITFAVLALICAFFTFSAMETQRRIRELPKIQASQRERAKEVVYGLAKDFNTTVVEDKKGLPKFYMVSGGQPLEITAAANNLIVSLPVSTDGFRIYVYPHELIRANGFRKTVDVAIRDPDFDKRFLIQTNDSNKVPQFLTPTIRDAIHQLADLVGQAPMGVALNVGELKCYVPLPMHDDWRAIKQCVQVVNEFQRSMGLWFDDPQAIKIQEAVTSDDGETNCLVCGDPIHLALIKCSSCRTPHHLECWDYIGSCSVFGCGSKKYHLDRS